MSMPLLFFRESILQTESEAEKYILPVRKVPPVGTFGELHRRGCEPELEFESDGWLFFFQQFISRRRESKFPRKRFL